MAQHIVAVDFDQAAVRVVEARSSSGGRISIRNYNEAALPEGTVRNGEVIEPGTLATVLKQLWSQAKIGSKDVVLGIGDQKVVARDLVMPKVSVSEMRRLLPLRVQELIPMPVAEAILDYYPVADAPPTSEGPAVRGLLVAAYSEAVSANVAAVKRAGLRVVGVDFLPFALYRAVGSPTAAVSAVVEIGTTSTSIVMARAGAPDFVRIIPSGSDDVTRALMAMRGITRPEALTIQAAQGLLGSAVDPNDAGSSTTIAEAIGELLKSIDNTLRYYASAHDGATASELVLTGAGARMPGLTEAVAEVTGINPAQPEPFTRVHMPRQLRSFGPSEALRMGAAIGLAMGARA
jgi:type IV pilus assembly protein PilM